MVDYIITFTTVSDARFPGRSILIGEVGGTRFYASFNTRRAAAESAIRKAFADAYDAAGSGN